MPSTTGPERTVSSAACAFSAATESQAAMPNHNKPISTRKPCARKVISPDMRSTMRATTSLAVWVRALSRWAMAAALSSSMMSRETALRSAEAAPGKKARVGSAKEASAALPVSAGALAAAGAVPRNCPNAPLSAPDRLASMAFEPEWSDFSRFVIAFGAPLHACRQTPPMAARITIVNHYRPKFGGVKLPDDSARQCSVWAAFGRRLAKKRTQGVSKARRGRRTGVASAIFPRFKRAKPFRLNRILP